MSPLRGILLKVISVCVFVAMSSLIKATSDAVPPGQAVFFRSLFAIPVIGIWLAMRGELHTGLRTKNPMGHVWRGLVGTTSMGLGFAGLGLLPLPEVTAIGYAAPILVVIFAAMFLGEDVRLFRLMMVAFGLVGVLVVLSPRLHIDPTTADSRETLGALVVLLSAVFSALASVFVRRLVQTETTSAIVFYFSITATLLSLLTLPWGWAMPSPKVAALLILAGLLGGVGQILMTTAYRHADASLIAPFEYTSMLLAIVVGYTVFGEVPVATTLAGGAMIVIAGILIILRERQLGIERARQRKTGPTQN
ncbi:DMT family transporter [Roseicyclus mahoneyensis]|jgi:drug/metabolite transporter (DMT)-like permease|uniref:Drug/metabolite transporter (DMT)-like permease n=1 Tax=Roseicyclus mahoneyensis TaxID=164332 RepID=A0A316GJE5_9RHOB|nr:DMT family transporter [Roseicyclus mahoneyensis]PWK60114.1 drug/metabolite transporter (DMT)-like permease [Roseicyclus mahoneyensis]